jgi:uncharacterized membrane protein
MNTSSTSNQTSSQLTKKMVYTALMTALVFISTYVIQIPVPFTGGYIHAGDSMVFLAGLLLGPLYGAFAAGAGSALADLLGGYTLWILPTLIIKALMACMIGLITQKVYKKLNIYSTLVLGALWVGFTAITLFLVKSTSQGTALFSKTLLGLSEEAEMVMENTELIALLNTTGDYLLLILIGVPIAIGILLFIEKQKKTFPIYISIAYILAGIIMVFGYYVAYGIISSNFMVPIFSIPSNMLQFIGGFLIAVPLTPVILYIRKSLT